jgi:hypothetical protein
MQSEEQAKAVGVVCYLKLLFWRSIGRAGGNHEEYRVACRDLKLEHCDESVCCARLLTLQNTLFDLLDTKHIRQPDTHRTSKQ